MAYSWPGTSPTTTTTPELAVAVGTRVGAAPRDWELSPNRAEEAVELQSACGALYPPKYSSSDCLGSGDEFSPVRQDIHVDEASG